MTTKPTALLLFAPLLFLTACSGTNALNVGSSEESPPNGSYTGSTLNSPVSDQNPHPGGDPSYPDSVSDQGKEPVPPDKTDGR
jgi:hypothetical protein